MSEITRPVNINLYLSSGIDDDEAERLAAILSEALDEHGFPRVTPDPVPEWRQFVDASPAWIKQAHRDDPRALAWTLENLAQVALEEQVPRALARIVAICEAKVGDGWQADPERDKHCHPGLAHTVNCVAWLLRGPVWQRLGDRCAAWLRDLTEGGTRWDGEHRSSQCQIDQLVTADRPEQDVLLAEVEALRAQVQQLGDARHGPEPYPWHCPACQELHRVLGGAS